MGSKGLARILALAALAVVPACGSDRGADKTSPGPSRAVADKGTAIEKIDTGYAPTDVWHSFKTKFGETIDCVDFFQQPGAKMLAAMGRPVTTMPIPPPQSTGAEAQMQHSRGKASGDALSEVMFNGSPDEDGNSRSCPDGSVPILRWGKSPSIGNPAAPRASHKSPPLAQPPTSMQAKSTPPGTLRPELELTAAPPPPASGACSQQFSQGDLSNEFDAYGHVQQTLYPGSSTALGSDWATLSIYDPVPPYDTTLCAVTEDSHTLMQLWTYSGWGFQGFGCSCGGTTGIPCTQTVEVGWVVDPIGNSCNNGGLCLCGTNTTLPIQIGTSVRTDARHRGHCVGGASC
jgi:hypothetical protein